MVTSFVFTEAAIKALDAPAVGRDSHKDKTFPGLQVHVTSKGAKSFYFVKRVDGKPKKIWLGLTSQLSVVSARKAAARHAAAIASGANPAADRRLRLREPTLDVLWESYLEIHSKRQKRTWKDDIRKYTKYLPTLHKMLLSEITTQVVAEWHGRIGREHGPITANCAKSLLSSMFAKASAAVGFTGQNPCRGVARFPEKSRERFLLPAEMQSFFGALALEDAYWQAFFLLCLFTGSRRGNVQSMEWSELDLSGACWHIPGSKTKNGKPTTLTLCAPALAILNTRYNERSGSLYVFPSTGGKGHLANPNKPWARITETAGLVNLHIHDLRRTQGSWQAAAGVPLNVIGKSLGHSSLASTQIYARLQLDPVRQAVSNASDSMIKAAGFAIDSNGMKMITVEAKSVEDNG